MNSHQTDWEKNIISISEEHLMTVKIKKFLSNINITFSDKKYKIDAYCFTLSDDSHDLSLYMYESLVSSKNIKVFNLGASLPVEDFIKLSNKQNVDIIFISTEIMSFLSFNCLFESFHFHITMHQNIFCLIASSNDRD